MKCIHCQHDAKYRDRSDGRCPKCQRRFAFEPQRGDPMTDGVFAAALERVSSHGSVHFHVDHLYYEVRRRHRRTFTRAVIATAGVIGFVTMIAGFIVGMQALVFVLLAACTVFGLCLWISQSLRDRRRLPRPRFDTLLRRFTDAHGLPAGLIERQHRSGERSAERAANLDEMLAYSFDRAVICDRAETVDLLLANQFHFENNCAVLAIDGYPQHAFETVRRMLRNNPRLIVVALHDASEAGCKLAHRLRNDPAWFKDGVPVRDVGLRPAHRKSFPGQSDRRVPRREVLSAEGISIEEAKWLAHSTLALAVVVPEQVIKRLFRAISVVEEQQDESGSAGSSSSGGDFDSDADATDGGGDSFG